MVSVDLQRSLRTSIAARLLPALLILGADPPSVDAEEMQRASALQDWAGCDGCGKIHHRHPSAGGEHG